MANTTPRGYEYAEPTDPNDLAFVSERLAKSLDVDVQGIADDVEDLLDDVTTLKSRPDWVTVNRSEEGWTFNTKTRWVNGVFWVSIDWQRTGSEFTNFNLILLTASNVPTAAKPGTILYPAGQVVVQHSDTPVTVQVDADGTVRAVDVSGRTNTRIRGLLSWPGA